MFNKKEYMKKYNKMYREKNSEYCKKYGREHYKKNSEYYKEYAKRYRKEHPEYHKEYRKKYNKEYSKEYYKRNKEKERERKKIYRKTKNGKATSQRFITKRRTKMKDIKNTLTYREWKNILKEYKNRCAYCGIKFDSNILPERDHVIPIDKGGDNTKENIVPACRSCNAKKSNKILKERG